MIGDRGMTDIAQAKLMGGLGIKVEPFDEDGESRKVKMVRKFENWYYRDISKNEILDF